MAHPHDHIAHIMLAIVLGATPWLVGFIEQYGFWMTHVFVPTLSATVLIGQLWMMWRRRRRQ